MKKIIAAINALHFTEEELQSYEYIAKELNGRVTVVFLENLTVQELQLANAYTDMYTMDYARMAAETREQMDIILKENLQKFNRICAENNLDFKLHEAKGLPVEEVITESRFADLLLINANTSFSMLRNSNPPAFVKDVLAHAQCPVMVLPEMLHPIKELVFSYNGSFSSMYAIRQLTQLFSGFSDARVNVVYVAEGDNKVMPHGKLVRDYLEEHYEDVKFTVLNGDPGAEFLALLLHRNDCLVTYGAYGRSRLSRFFHHSDAETVLRTINIPVFITHP
ncbi:Universal stress protein family protein [Chitinophaga rupis]|uniref:Universal stress protein family protein n=1 Tax=Chitinophaga rupis TaxID=573321 RepID=A0A1H7PV42_9BACT|nr:universal stress protein [Chitinophaga rupis]SEL39751.1 Universal stress protein family protein [Chitinophaga rupis]